MLGWLIMWHVEWYCRYWLHQEQLANKIGWRVRVVAAVPWGVEFFVSSLWSRSVGCRGNRAWRMQWHRSRGRRASRRSCGATGSGIPRSRWRTAVGKCRLRLCSSRNKFAANVSQNLGAPSHRNSWNLFGDDPTVRWIVALCYNPSAISHFEPRQMFHFWLIHFFFIKQRCKVEFWYKFSGERLNVQYVEWWIQSCLELYINVMHLCRFRRITISGMEKA